MWGAAIAAVLAALGIFAAPKVKHAYDRWSGTRAVKRAAEAMASGDIQRAVLDARVAIEADPLDVEANRIIAQALESTGSPSALEWRRRLGSIRPDDVENLIAWAKGALKEGYPDTAANVLGKVKPEDRNSAAYHDAAARIAITRQDDEEAESHWKEAARLDPKEERYRLDLALLQRKTGDSMEREQALAALRELAANPASGGAAQRALLADALAGGDAGRAMALATALASAPEAKFEDRLLRLTVARKFKHRDSSPLLAELRDAAVANPEELYKLLSWMNANDLALLVLDWMRELPADVLAKPPVCVAVAEARAHAMDWENLQIAVEAGTWGSFEFARHAYHARALQRLDFPAESGEAWLKAVWATENRPDRIEALSNLAFRWRWEQRGTELLWKMAASGSAPRRVTDTLWADAVRRTDTDQLRTLSKLRMNADPRSVEARNNFAFLSLITRSAESSVHELVETLVKETPDNAEVVSTYAFSLYQRGRIDDALSAMKNLNPEQLRMPSVARYHAIFLTAAGRGAEAREFVALGEQGFVLPEEKTLLNQAKATAAREPSATPK